MKEFMGLCGGFPISTDFFSLIRLFQKRNFFRTFCLYRLLTSISLLSRNINSNIRWIVQNINEMFKIMNHLVSQKFNVLQVTILHIIMKSYFNYAFEFDEILHFIIRILLRIINMLKINIYSATFI
jgi:hypothetical protein